MLKLSILGIRGIPAQYGGFETFAERLSKYLVSQGWEVTVYCQEEHKNQMFEEYWNGIRLVHIPVPYGNALGSIIFDWKSTLHALKQKGIVLTLGYNTAIFSVWYRLKGITNFMNMDGLEWKRSKWRLPERIWLYLNEWAGCWLANSLIADHPAIKSHLLTRKVASEKITVIPYGTEKVVDADSQLLTAYNLVPKEYALVIARPEPENSILEIVSGFSRRPRGLKLVVLGRYLPDQVPYHKQVLEAASDEVIFPGAIYNKSVVNALRFHARLYIHGHQVGGTNPSLVEALSAGQPVLANNNRFNRWVAGPGAHYFKNEAELEEKLEILLNDGDELQKMKLASKKRYDEEFAKDKDIKAYERLFLSKAKQLHQLALFSSPIPDIK